MAHDQRGVGLGRGRGCGGGVPGGGLAGGGLVGGPVGGEAKAAVPFGVPRPVGPSQPDPATQITVPQKPFEPEVTSKRLPTVAYGYEAG